MKKPRLRRALCLLLCLLLALPALLFRLPTTARAEETTQSTIIVSLGDSYASGEGIEPFYGESGTMAERARNADWLAHRSQKAWAGMLTLPAVSGTMAQNRGTNWFFAASSGATTEHIRRTGDTVVDAATGRREGQQTKTFDRDGVKGTCNLPGQLDIFYDTPGLDRFEVDYVTLSIGGNDVDFAGILRNAAASTLHSTALYDSIDEKISSFYDEDGTYYKLRGAYERVAEAAPNATILVVGYPELLDPDGKSVLFSKDECEYINAAVRAFNLRIQALTADCQRDGMKIEFISVEDAFRNHQAYSDDPYINPVYFGPRTQPQDLKAHDFTSAYSMHPNYYGAKAYAGCVQAVIDRLEQGSVPGGAVEEAVSVSRDIVLVLDTSYSMSFDEGRPMEMTRLASGNFVDTILQKNTRIGIVTYDDDARLRSDFNTDHDSLADIVRDLQVKYKGSTNTEGGLMMAEQLLDNSPADKKVIVLISDGQPTVGKKGDELIAYADALREKGFLIYTVGFFTGLDADEKAAAQPLMERIASDCCHIEVADTAELSDYFGDIADQLRGKQHVYIRIECPADVKVTSGDETLSSSGSDYNTRTSFGTLTFEESESESASDNRVKILRLREGADYSIEIRGNGDGTLRYTAGFADVYGEYADVRKIEDVPVTRKTLILGNALRGEETTLRVDSNGDGLFDKTYTVNGLYKKTLPLWAWAVIGVCGVLMLVVIVSLLTMLGRRNQKKPAPASGPAPQGTAAPYRGRTVLVPPAGTYTPPARTYPPPTQTYPPQPGTGQPPVRTAPSPTQTYPPQARTYAPPARTNAPQTRGYPAAGAAAPRSGVPTAAPAARPAGRFCSHCGAPLAGATNFCSNCGNLI